jgi:hypothetical protein
MAALRAILEIFGTLDTAVARSSDPLVLSAANALVPGSPENTGWYAELDAFMFPGGDLSQPDRSLEPPRTEPDFGKALGELTDPEKLLAEPLTIPQLARLVYGIGAAIRLNSIVSPGPIPGWTDPTQGDGRALIVNALALAGPADSGGNVPLATTASNIDARLDQVQALFSGSLTSYEQWNTVAQELVRQGLIDPRIAHELLEHASVVTIDGIKSLVVDTEFTSTEVSLNALKDVVDPRNWHLNYPAFFCAMEGGGRRPDGWRRVLETVGAATIPYSRRLCTNLKFYKTERNDPGHFEARLDYDLNDPVPDPAGDRQIDVDRGFINMRATTGDPNAGGVVVRTRKVAHIKGIRPETQARFCFIFGYTTGALDMLFGPATNPNRPVAQYYPWADLEDRPGALVSPGGQAPSSNSVASTAFRMAVGYSEDLIVRNLDLADKWMAGDLTLKDLADYSTEFGARLAGDPWKFLQAISRPKGGGT